MQAKKRWLPSFIVECVASTSSYRSCVPSSGFAESAVHNSKCFIKYVMRWCAASCPVFGRSGPCSFAPGIRFTSVALLRGSAPRQASGLGYCLGPTQDCVLGHFYPVSSPIAFNACSFLPSFLHRSYMFCVPVVYSEGAFPT